MCVSVSVRECASMTFSVQWSSRGCHEFYVFVCMSCHCYIAFYTSPIQLIYEEPLCYILADHSKFQKEQRGGIEEDTCSNKWWIHQMGAQGPYFSAWTLRTSESPGWRGKYINAKSWMCAKLWYCWVVAYLDWNIYSLLKHTRYTWTVRLDWHLIISDWRHPPNYRWETERKTQRASCRWGDKRLWDANTPCVLCRERTLYWFKTTAYKSKILSSPCWHTKSYVFSNHPNETLQNRPGRLSKQELPPGRKSTPTTNFSSGQLTNRAKMYKSFQILRTSILTAMDTDDILEDMAHHWNTHDKRNLLFATPNHMATTPDSAVWWRDMLARCHLKVYEIRFATVFCVC